MSLGKLEINRLLLERQKAISAMLGRVEDCQCNERCNDSGLNMVESEFNGVRGSEIGFALISAEVNLPLAFYSRLSRCHT